MKKLVDYFLMQKMANKKLSIGILFLLFIAVILTINISASETIAPFNKSHDYNGNGRVDLGDMAYYYGLHPEKITEDKLTPEQTEFIFGEYISDFLKGVEKSTSDSKLKVKIFAELWQKKAKDKPQLSDELKNSIWKKLTKEQRKEFFSEYGKQIFDKMKKNNEKFYEGYNKELLFENLESDKLTWSGNKLVSQNQKDKGKSVWIDFDRLPLWTDGVKYVEGKGDENGYFEIDLSSKNLKKKAIIRSGTIGPAGEIIGPDGNPIGQRYNFLKGIKYEGGKLICDYELNGVSKTISIDEKNINKAYFDNIKDFISKKTGLSRESIDSKTVVEYLDKILKDMSGAGTSSSEVAKYLGFDFGNQLNIMYGKKSSGTEVFDIDFDSEGKPNIKLSNGALLVSSNSNGDATTIYRQNGNGEGRFIFGRNGRIEGGQNARVSLAREGATLGDIFTSGDTMVGIDVYRSGLVDAALTGNFAAIGELLKDPDRLKEFMQRGNGYDVRKMLEDAVQKTKGKIGEEEFNRELKDTLFGFIESSIMKVENIGKELLAKFVKEQDIVLNLGNPVVDYARKQIGDLATGFVEYLSNNPDKLNEILSGNPSEVQSKLGSILKDYWSKQEVSDRVGEDILGSEQMREIQGLLARMPNTGSNPSQNAEQNANIKKALMDMLKSDEMRAEMEKAFMNKDF